MSLSCSLESTPKVSVCVITYNQEHYIRECLQSIVDQETSFPIEIIVGDDCSTDSTPSIIGEFAERYPGLFVPILNKVKIGGTQNYVSTHTRARGTYVAHLDGDDVAYPGKLQRLADYLDKRADLALVWHAVDLFNDNGEITGRLHLHIDLILNTTKIERCDLLRFGSLGAASSMMYRREFAGFLSTVKDSALDYYFAVKLLEQGDGARLTDVLGGYRYNPSDTTLSKRGSFYFNRSPMRELYARHLSEFLVSDRASHKDIFLNALFNLCVELRFVRPSLLSFLSLAIKTFSFSALIEVPSYFSKALKLRIR